MCWLARLLSTRIDTSTLLRLAGTLCCCGSSNLGVFCDRAQLGADFAIGNQSINQVPPIDSDSLTNELIDWNRTLSTFVGLSSCLVRANNSSCSRSHHLSPYSAPVHFPLFCWMERALVSVLWNSTKRKCQFLCLLLYMGYYAWCWLSHVHAQGVKQSVLSVCLSVCPHKNCQIWRSRRYSEIQVTLQC